MSFKKKRKNKNIDKMLSTAQIARAGYKYRQFGGNQTISHRLSDVQSL